VKRAASTRRNVEVALDAADIATGDYSTRLRLTAGVLSRLYPTRPMRSPRR
jgi:hypothetical protein